MPNITGKSPEDILKEVKAKIKGVNPNDIKFQDLRKKKKYSRKKTKKSNESESETGIIDNKEGLVITGAGAAFCDYSEVSKGRKRRFIDKDTLEEWGAFDFYRFANKLYIDKYGNSWNLQVGGNSLEINKIRDKFYDLFGFCCNLIMRDYIVYFFNNHIDKFIRDQGEFYFNQMSNDWIILSFQENYNFRERFADYMREKNSDGKKSTDLTRKELKQAFLIGDTTLIGNYGIVITLNWLLKIKKMSKVKATDLVVDACKEMYRKGNIDIIKNSTESYSPYPSNLAFRSPQLVIDKIDKNIKLNVNFTDNNKMVFLQKGNR